MSWDNSSAQLDPSAGPTKVDLVVTRHPALVELLRELGLVGEDVEVVTHVSDPSVLDGRVVAGVLPLHLAARAWEVWEVRLNLRPEDRGRELSLDELRDRFGGVYRYRVVRLGQIG